MATFIVNNNNYAVKKLHNKDNHYVVNEKDYHCDIQKIDANTYHLIFGAHSIKVFVEKKKGAFLFKVKEKVIAVNVVDKYNELLNKIGITTETDNTNDPVKAPMPGLVLETLVKPGDYIEKGNSLLILEAMKMENVLKSEYKGKIKEVKINKGDKVDKNQVLITFE